MPKTTKPMKTATAEAVPSRDVEKLIALLRYEMSGIGSGSAEILEDLFATTKDLLLEPPDEAGDFEDLERLRRDCRTFAEYLLRGLVATGRMAEAQIIVEDRAAARRKCDARFGIPREIPLTGAERDALTKEWGSLNSTEAH